ncbi:MAG: cell division protein FtsH, partial [Thermaerobacter sp.]|nr:cell division protein FtsH [Thermaerobacter sp.]
MTNRWVRGILTAIFALLLISTLWELTTSPGGGVVQESYTRLMTMAKDGQVAKVTIDAQSSTVKAVTKNHKHFQTTYAAGGTASLANRLVKDNVTVTIEHPAATSFWLSLLTNFLPVLAILFMFYFFFSQTQGGGGRVMQFGKSRARLHSADDRRRVTFDDVAGVEEEKQELAELVDF